MNNDSSSRTSATLLEGLRHDPGDPASWARFTDRYGPRIKGWCRAWGLQEADADDVTQEVLLKLARKLAAFEYDPARSFRGWLRTVVRNTWHDWATQVSRHRGGSEEVWARLQSPPAADDLEARIQEEFEQHVLAEAKEQVRPRVEAATWAVYELTVEQQLSGADAAARLNMPVATVYKYKSRVQQLLQAEVRRLLEAEGA